MVDINNIVEHFYFRHVWKSLYGVPGFGYYHYESR